MKDTISIIDLDEQSCIARALSKTDNKIHRYDIKPWVLHTYIDVDYEVDISDIDEDLVNVLSFKEVEHPKRHFLW